MVGRLFIMNEFATYEKKVKSLYDKLKNINIPKMVEDISRENDVQTWIKDTIRERHLEKGEDAFDEKMQTDRSSPGEPYAFVTMDLKDTFGSGYGSIIDHVTLYDTGEFWKSLRVVVIKNGFRTEADFLKKDGHMYDNFNQDYSSEKEFEDAVTGLTEKQFKDLITTYYLPKIDEKIHAILQN
jgi:hypothetical protein